MQQVRGGVVAPRAIAPHGIGLGLRQLSAHDFAFGDPPIVDDVARVVETRVVDGEHAARRSNGACVADLAAALRVEGRSLEDEAIIGHRENARLRLRVSPGEELSLRQIAELGVCTVAPFGELGRTASTLTLSLA